MKLHWSPKSPYVRKVMVCAHELGCVQKLTLIRSVAAMLKPNPAIMQDNPLNKIPTLVLDDGSALFDSRVICEFLNANEDGDLFPNTGSAQWKTLRWQALGDGLLDLLILWRNEREKALPMAALMGAFEIKSIAALKLLETEAHALENAPFSIGPIVIACALGYLDFRFETLAWRSHAPTLATWFEMVSARPSLLATQPELDA